MPACSTSSCLSVTSTRVGVWFPPATATPMQRALMAALLPSVNETRKQTVHKTRINAGGYGAMGPHPEREPA